MGEEGDDGGQFFSQREVIRAMVRVIDPKIGETVYDPGCGTGSFLAQANEHMAGANNEKNVSPDQLETLKRSTLYGREKDNAIYPIALANLMVHGIDEPHIWHGNTLTGAGVKTNLLFFTKGRPTERIWYYDLSDVKVGKKKPLTLSHFDEFFRLLLTRGDSKHSWTVTRQEIEARDFDLKAINRLRKSGEDPRRPEELIALIREKGREVEDVLAALSAPKESDRFPHPKDRVPAAP